MSKYAGNEQRTPILVSSRYTKTHDWARDKVVTYEGDEWTIIIYIMDEPFTERLYNNSSTTMNGYRYQAGLRV